MAIAISIVEQAQGAALCDLALAQHPGGSGQSIFKQAGTATGDLGAKCDAQTVQGIGFEQALTDRRGEPVSVEAMRLIQGLGANFVPTSALFGIWKASLVDALQARNSVMRLHSMDGGIYR